MLRRLFVLLTLSGLIATYTCEPLDKSNLEHATKSVDCNNDDNNDDEDGGACRFEREQNRLTRNPTNTRTSKSLEQEFLKFANEDDAGVTSRSKKRKGYGNILLYVIGAAKATMLYVILHGVAALAAKALIVAKVALIIATAVALKKSTEHSDKVSYEIIKHPEHSYIQTHSSSVDYDHHGGYDEDHRRRRKVFQ